MELSVPAIALFLLVLGGSIEAWRILWRGRRLSGTLLPLEPRRPVPWGGAIVLLIVVFYLTLMSAVPLVARVDLDDGDELTAQQTLALMLVMSLANLATVAIGTWLLTRLRRADAYDLGLPSNAEMAAADIRLGTLGFFASVIPVLAVQVGVSQLVKYEHPLIDMLLVNATPRFWLVAALSAAVAAPVAEEFFFRLVFQGWLERLFRARPLQAAPEMLESGTMAEQSAEPTAESPEEFAPAEGQRWELASDEQRASPYASPLGHLPPDSAEHEPQIAEPSADESGWRPTMPILISSAVFALMHYGQGAAPVPLFFLALGLGYIYFRTHRLLPCIVLHALFNGYSLLLLALSL